MKEKDSINKISNIEYFQVENRFFNFAKNYFVSPEVGRLALKHLGLIIKEEDKAKYYNDDPVSLKDFHQKQKEIREKNNIKLSKEEEKKYLENEVKEWNEKYLKNYNNIEKFYKDKDGKLQPFNNGEEIIKLNEQVINQYNELKEKFKNKNIAPNIASDITRSLNALHEVLSKPFVTDKPKELLQNIKNKNPNLSQPESLERLPQKYECYKLFDTLKKAQENLTNIANVISQEKPIGYGMAIPMKNYNSNEPSNHDMIKGLSKLIAMQDQITGIKLTDPKFQDKLRELKPEALNEIMLSFENVKGTKAIYSISPNQFIKLLNGMDENMRKSIPETTVLADMDVLALSPLRKHLQKEFHFKDKDLDDFYDINNKNTKKLFSPEQKEAPQTKKSNLNQASENISSQPHKKGNLELLDKNHVYGNIAESFLKIDAIAQNVTNYFHLGVEKKDFLKVYNKDNLPQEELNKIPKYYIGNDGNLKNFDNGKELIESYGKLASILQDMQNKHGNKSYSLTTQKEVNRYFEEILKDIQVAFNPERQPENINNARNSIINQQNDEIKKSFSELLKNPKLDSAIQNDIKNLLEPSDQKFHKEVGNFLKNIEGKGISNEQIKEIIKLHEEDKNKTTIQNNEKIKNVLKELGNGPNIEEEYKKQVGDLLLSDRRKFSKEVDNILVKLDEKKIDDRKIEEIKSVHEESVNIRLNNLGGDKNDYVNILNSVQNATTKFEALSKKLEKAKTLDYGAVISINESSPTKEDFNKALAKLLIEQKNITGLDHNDPDFKEKLNKINPKSLGKLQLTFDYTIKQKNAEDNTDIVQKYTEYKINNKAFIDLLKKVNDPLSLNLNSEVVITPKGLEKTELTIGKNDILKILKDSASNNLSDTLQAHHIGKINIDFDISKKEGVDTIKNSLSSSKNAFKTALRENELENVKVTIEDLRNNKQHEIIIKKDVLTDLLNKTLDEKHSSITFEKINASERRAILDNLSPIFPENTKNIVNNRNSVGEYLSNDNAIFTDRNIIKPKIYTVSFDSAPLQTNTNNLSQKEKAHIIFPEQAREVFHQLREGKDINQSQTLDNSQRRENRAASAEIDSSIKAPPSQAKQATEPQIKPLGAQASSRSSQQAEAGITNEGVETTARVSQPPNRPPPEIPKARDEVKAAAAEVAQSPLKVDQKEWDNFAAKFANNQEKAANPEVTNAKAAAGAEVKPATGIANEGKETTQAVLQEGNRSRSNSINNVENTTRSRSDSVSDKDFDKILKEMNENLAGLEQVVKGKEKAKSKGLEDALKEFDVLQQKMQESIVKETIKDRTVATEKFVELDEKLTKKLNKINENNVEKYNENNLDKEAERALKKLAKFDKEMAHQAEVETKQTEELSKEPRSRASSVVEPSASQNKASNSASISSEEPPPITRPRSNAIGANNFNPVSNEASQDKNTKVFENKQFEVQAQSSNTEKESPKWKEANPSPGIVEARNEQEATQEEAKKKQGFLKRVMNVFKPLTDFIKRNNERSDHNVKEMAEKVASAHEAKTQSEPKKVHFAKHIEEIIPPETKKSFEKNNVTEIKEAKKENITHPPSTPKGEIKIGKHRENPKKDGHGGR